MGPRGKVVATRCKRISVRQAINDIRDLLYPYDELPRAVWANALDDPRVVRVASGRLSLAGRRRFLAPCCWLSIVTPRNDAVPYRCSR